MKTENTFDISPTIGAGFLSRIFGGKSFMHCIIELIKNPLDWGATKIYFFTEDKSTVRVLDDGYGMDRANRNAFSSLNTTTALDPKQSGFFCTGSKKMLFSHSKSVVITTAPKDDPEHVFRFEISVAEYEKKILNGDTLTCRRMPKNAQTWPYEFKFGTDLRYVLAEPKSRSIVRGAQLASELSDRLSLMFSNIVLVDGTPIPRKEIIGEEVQLTWNKDKKLGPVTVLLYHPKNPRPEDELRFTSGVIGEIPMRNFLKAIGEFRDRVPEIYHAPGVCGVFSASFLKDYANEDRDTLNPGLADDKNLLSFLNIMDFLTEEIKQKLKITLKDDSARKDEQTQLNEVVDLFNRRYNPEAVIPDAGPVDDPVDGPGVVVTETPPSERRALTLRCKDEYELGESIEIVSAIQPDLQSTYPPESVVWNPDRCRAEVVGPIATGGMTLKATELGAGVVIGTLHGNPCTAIASYEIVKKRIFQMRHERKNVQIHGVISIPVMNLDKLKGKPKWTHEGVGELTQRDGKATFHATSVGGATVTAYDSANLNTTAKCEITVLGQPGKFITIKKQHFKVGNFDRGTVDAKPVDMTRGDKHHFLWLTNSAPALVKAREQKNLRSFLAHTISFEFARFSRFVLGEERIEDMDPRDIELTVNEIITEGYSILYEVGFTEGK